MQKRRELLVSADVSSDRWEFSADEGLARFQPVPCALPQHKTALRVEILKPSPSQPWAIGLGQKILEAIPANSMLRIRFFGRSKTRHLLSVMIERNAGNYEKLFLQSIEMTPDWQEYAVAFKIPRDVPENWSQLAVHLGAKTGEVELTGFSVEDWGIEPKPQPKNINFSLFSRRGEPNAAWWKEADARIDQHRKTDLTVRVLGADNRPLAGARIEVEQQRHAFRFGTALAPDPLLRDTEDGKQYQKTVVELFNAGVLENAHKWRAEPDNWFPVGTADRMLDWCERHKLAMRGHCLVWLNYEHLPVALRSLRGDELHAALKERIQSAVQKNRGRVYVWDVVNEAVTNREIINELGGEKLLKEIFQWAREADPKVGLAYNEFNILNEQGGMNQPHRERAARIIRDMQAAKTPLTHLGIQGHMSSPFARARRLWEILDEWAKFKLPLEITEYDATLTHDQENADYLREFLTATFSHPAIASFVMWGFWEGAHWRAHEGGAMFRRDWTPRPAVQVYKELLFKRWWTKAQTRTARDGEAKLRVFKGDYLVKVTHQGKTMTAHVDARSQAQVTLKL